MSEKKNGQGFFGKIFGGKRTCCSVEIEEIQKDQDKTESQTTIEKSDAKKKRP